MATPAWFKEWFLRTTAFNSMSPRTKKRCRDAQKGRRWNVVNQVEIAMGLRCPKLVNNCFLRAQKTLQKYATFTRSRIQQNDSKFGFGAHQLLKTDRSWHCSLCILGSNNSLHETHIQLYLERPYWKESNQPCKMISKHSFCTVCIMGTKGWKWKYSWYTVDIHNSYNAARTESTVHVSHALPLWEPKWIKWIKWPAKSFQSRCNGKWSWFITKLRSWGPSDSSGDVVSFTPVQLISRRGWSRGWRGAKQTCLEQKIKEQLQQILTARSIRK